MGWKFPKENWTRIVSFGVFLIVGMWMGVFMLAFLTAGAIYEYTDSFPEVGQAELPPVDVIVCLAGGRGRIKAAANLWYRYKVGQKDAPRKLPLLYISGMGPKATFHTLKKQVGSNVLDTLAENHVYLETESADTVENARWVAEKAREDGWSHIVLVTSSYHMKRSRYIFWNILNRLGMKRVKIETLSVFNEPYRSDQWKKDLTGIRVTLFEYLKWVYYRAFWLPEA